MLFQSSHHMPQSFGLLLLYSDIFLVSLSSLLLSLTPGYDRAVLFATYSEICELQLRNIISIVYLPMSRRDAGPLLPWDGMTVVDLLCM